MTAPTLSDFASYTGGLMCFGYVAGRIAEAIADAFVTWWRSGEGGHPK